MPKKTGLGMGLDALFEDNSGDTQGVQTVRISQIEPNKSQPRKMMNEETIAELAESIRVHGVIQPILVRPCPSGYKIVAGERRWRACRMLGMTEIPVIVKHFTDSQSAQIALIENIQREDLNPIDEAKAYKELMETHGMTQETLSEAIGKSRSTIANSIRLLTLPDSVLDMLKKGALSSGQAKVIAGLKQKEMIEQLAKEAAGGNITVKKLEKTVSELNGEAASPKKDAKKNAGKPKADKQALNFITEMEISLENALSRKVKITSPDGEKGAITIDFFDKDDLSVLADKLTLY